MGIVAPSAQLDLAALAPPPDESPTPAAVVAAAAGALQALLPANEAFLMERTLSYAHARGYTKYTSTLVEAWRASVAGLTKALCEGLARFGTVPELGPDGPDLTDPMVAFGVAEAAQHRRRGTPLAMFLGLMKYYHQAYRDLVAAQHREAALEAECLRCVDRFFDRMEIAFCQEWSLLSSGAMLEELQSASRSLTNEKNRYLTIFESLLEPVFLLDEAGAVTGWNHAAAAQVGGSAEAPGTFRYGDGARPEWVDRVAAPLGALVPEGRQALELETPAGRRQYEAASRPLLDISKKFTGRVVVLHDVSDRLRAQVLQREFDAEAAVVERLRAFHHELVETERMASLGQLAAGVAHELTEPMGWVRSNLDEIEAYFERAAELITALAQVSPELKHRVDGLPLHTDDVAEMLEETVDGCLRVQRTVERLTSFAGPSTDAAELVDVREVLEDALLLTNRTLSARAELMIELEPLPKVRGKAGELGQVMLNLLLNAGQALTGHGLIRVRAWAVEEGACIEITDNGRGIPADVLPHIFEPFLTSRRESTGLGLAAAWGVVKAHGGRLTAESEPGKGTTMRVWLPAA